MKLRQARKIFDAKGRSSRKWRKATRADAMQTVSRWMMRLFQAGRSGRVGHAVWACLILPLLFTGCGLAVEGFAPDLDYEVETSQPAKPVVAPVVDDPGPVNIDGKIEEGPWEPVQSPAAECGPNGCRLPARAAGRVLEAAGDGPVRRVFSRQPVRRVFGACRFGRCG